MGSDKLLRLKNLEKAISKLKVGGYVETSLIFTGFDMGGMALSEFPLENIPPHLLIDLFQSVYNELRIEILKDLGVYDK